MMAQILGNMIGQEHQSLTQQQRWNLLESTFGNRQMLDIFLKLDCQSVRLMRSYIAGQRVRGVNAFATTNQCLMYIRQVAINDCQCNGFWIARHVTFGMYGLNGIFCSGCGVGKDSHQDFEYTVKLFDFATWFQPHQNTEIN